MSPLDLMLCLRRTTLLLALHVAMALLVVLAIHPNFSRSGHYHHHTSGNLVIIWWIFGGIALLIAFARDRAQWYARKRAVLAAKPTRWRYRKVVAVPEGEHVRLVLHERGLEPVAWCFHAEDEAEAAQELVAEFRARPKPTPLGDGSTPEARALANTLRRR